MKRVVLLTEDEKKDYKFKVPCMSFITPYLCRTLTPAEIERERQVADKPAFLYERFGFFTVNHKLDDYIACMSGVIVIISYATMLKNRVEIEARLQKIRCRPLLLIVHETPHDATIDNIRSTSNSFKVVYDTGGNSISFDLRVFANELKEPTIPVSAVNISNENMIKMFETQTLPITAWDHYGRVRIVYLALKMHGYKNSIDPAGWLCRNWKKYKSDLGHGHLWNYTLTRFWIEIVAHARECKSNSGYGFKSLWRADSNLRDSGFHKQFYSRERLMNPEARERWVPPDLQSLELYKPGICNIS